MGNWKFLFAILLAVKCLFFKNLYLSVFKHLVLGACILFAMCVCVCGDRRAAVGANGFSVKNTTGRSVHQNVKPQ